jgi:hypothetical protein
MEWRAARRGVGSDESDEDGVGSDESDEGNKRGVGATRATRATKCGVTSDEGNESHETGVKSDKSVECRATRRGVGGDESETRSVSDLGASFRFGKDVGLGSGRVRAACCPAERESPWCLWSLKREWLSGNACGMRVRRRCCRAQ